VNSHPANIINSTAHVSARGVLCMLVIVSILLPRVSLALASMIGTGFDSVVICTGSGLSRGIVDASGEIIDDVSDTWSGDHCAPITALNRQAEQRWATIHLRQNALVDVMVPASSAYFTNLTSSNTQARAPPLA
jgi:hypothetical protein